MRHPIRQAVGVFVGLALAAGACAQPYPSKPIRYIVPFPPGGPTDTFSRALTAQLGEALGQPVVVENVPGAGASIGMDRLAKSPPDGYTIGLATTGSHAINPHLYGTKLTYNALTDFTPLTLAVSYVNVLVVNPAVPAKSVADLVAYAKANPGKVNFGSAGNGSSNHLSGELLKSLTGAPMQHVPYKGSAPALTDVVSGQLTFMFDILVTAVPQIRAGRVRGLAVTSAKRSPFAPDIPTMSESGVPGYAEAGADLWFGIVAPAGVPKPVVEKLNGELIRVLRSTTMRERISSQFFDVRTSTPAEFQKVIESDYEKWGKIVRASGARVD
ncbi:MAG TPA: tripartite tricarboxylate transporter substrate binding protein [Burkholderiales bacterium]|nr:tripartite tricarboxylate transporter substrate binding protein [Burkholderiales bacterium]